MKIDLTIDVERSVADTVTKEYLNECVLLALDALSQGHAKGVGLHPGLTVEWNVIRDEDGAL